ncbi:hypothetical protein MLD38_031732 [Melastoma candidum]|uniref:Uncharacterized protein n=1 Tax=Melastoma candidum TaxID=119954 RepID=A0ACB9MQK4_9MYRT|nr:hypothetical protein MLD38_031732 [Melastoma candidum]
MAENVACRTGLHQELEATGEEGGLDQAAHGTTESGTLSGVQQGFRYHHAESNYVMLLRWLPDSTQDALPANASHRVGIGVFFLNDNDEVLVVQENTGKLKDTDLWKLPVGVVNQEEDIWKAAA